MSSFCRSSAARFAFRTHSAGGLGPRFSSDSIPRPSPLVRRLPRFAPALASAESLMPLHSAIASACLKSNISVESRLWGWLTQGFCLTL